MLTILLSMLSTYPFLFYKLYKQQNISKVNQVRLGQLAIIKPEGSQFTGSAIFTANF